MQMKTKRFVFEAVIQTQFELGTNENDRQWAKQ